MKSGRLDPRDLEPSVVRIDDRSKIVESHCSWSAALNSIDQRELLKVQILAH
jgi:hypothetical protein